MPFSGTAIRSLLPAAVTAVLAATASPASAEVALDGWFVAQRFCPALQSIRRETNPGNIHTVPGRAYPMLAKNKDDATHYLLDVAGAEPNRRWVAVECGVHTVAVQGTVEPPVPQPKPPQPTPVPVPKPAGTDYVLAASWQPGFCETRPSKPECESQTQQRFDATHFALHGLWPQPFSNIYCNVPAGDVSADKAGRWDSLPALALEPQTRAALDEVMPGTQSNLQRHEWTKHGTCHGGTAEDYFGDSIRLMAALNASGVQDLFEASIGTELSASEVREAFDAAFGPGAGERVKLSCVQDGGRRLIGELTIGLSGELTEDADFAALLMASPPTDPGCPSGIVDAVGLQ